MSTEKPRIVLDCMICLQAVAKEESPAAALAEVRDILGDVIA